MHLLSRRLLSLLLIAFLGGTLVACDSGGSSGGGDTLPKSEAKTKLQNADTQVSTNTGELLSSGQFATTVRGLFSSSSTTTSGKQTDQPLGYVLIDSLDNVIQTANGRLDFSASTGEYSWNIQERFWEQTGSSGGIVLNFPSSPSETSNDATFTISDYSDLQVTLDGNTEYLPQTVAASMTVDGTEVFNVDLSNTSFYSGQVDGSQVPRSFDLSLLTLPHRQSIVWSSASKSEFGVDYDLQRADDNNQQVLGILVNATLNSAFDDVDGASGIDELSGELGIGPDVVIQYTVQVDELEQIEDDDPTVEELNDRFDAQVNYQGQKVGDIEIAMISTQTGQQRAPVLVYGDGSKEPLQQVFQNTFASVGTVAILGGSQLSLSTMSKRVYDSITNAANAVF